jgi:hypothetical protein
LEVDTVIDPRLAKEFLSHSHLAVVGASADPRNFGTTIYRELKGRGYDVVAVNPTVETVDGDPCYPGIASVSGQLEGAILVVPRDKSAELVRECMLSGVPRVWLFQGIGGVGAVSDEAVQLCQDNGLSVVAGACPMMFLEPAGWFHRAHRVVRRVKGAVGKESSGVTGGGE